VQARGGAAVLLASDVAWQHRHIALQNLFIYFYLAASRIFNGLLCVREKEDRRARKRKKGRALERVPKYVKARLVSLFPASSILALLVEV
jgi:hypothetical protein